MDAKTRDLALLAALSLFCTGVAWFWGYVILGSVFFALGGVAALGLAERQLALTASTQKGKAPALRGDGAEVMPHCSACGRDSEGQRRTFRAKAIPDRANWFRLPEKKPPQRGHSASRRCSQLAVC